MAVCPACNVDCDNCGDAECPQPIVGEFFGGSLDGAWFELDKSPGDEF